MCTHACCQNVREMRQGCYGALQGRHSFTAFILLNLHKESAERVMFSSFHRVCNTLKVIYYHFLGHTINFSKTFNGRAYDAASSISTSPEPNMINSAVRGACRAACRLAAHV